MFVEAVLSRIIFSDMDERHFLFLREKNGSREFAITVGIIEAFIIHRAVYDEVIPRPLTHHVLCNAINTLGGTLKDVAICDMDEDTFYASLRVQQDNRILEIDCRPSDALAAAIMHYPPLKILVEESVLEKVGSPKWEY